MRFRRALMYSIAGAAMMLVSPAPTLILDMPSSAQAANVSVSINTFYSDLAPYGSWVSYRDNYVFIPGRMAADWRPYTAGHWVFTRRYGWMWVSDEPFGWATYHYGRWGYSEDIGWYWVPGRRWAPAWVSWRRSRDHVVWAPLPPSRDFDVDISIHIRVSDIPDYYWVAVPSHDFLDADLTTVVINDETERVRVVQAAQPIGNVTIRNNIVVNNAIDVDYVQKTTDKKVEAVNVTETNDPKQAGKGSNGEVAVFNSEVKQEKGAKPAEVTDVETVKKEKAASGGTQPTTTQGQGTTQGQAEPGQEQPIKKKKKGTAEQPTQPEQGQAEQGQEQPIKKKKATTEQPNQPEQGQAEQGQEQPIKKKKATTSEQPSQPEQGQAEQEQPIKKKKKATTSEQPSQPEQGQAEQEQPTKKKRKPITSEQSTQPDQGQAEQEQTTKKRKYKASGQPAQQEEAQPGQGQEQPIRKRKSKSSEPTQGEQPQQGCDPSTGQNC